VPSNAQASSADLQGHLPIYKANFWFAEPIAGLQRQLLV
jgi:hypothetical protein